MKTAKRKQFLKTLPRGVIFSFEEIKKIREKFKLAATPEYLQAKGEECNWLTSAGIPFKTIESFCNAYNGIFCEEQRAEKNLTAKYRDYEVGAGDLFVRI